MAIRVALLGAVLAALTITSASATVRIAGDTGGQIGPYLQRLATLRDSGERIVIDGACLSACTMILGVIPADRICVTPRARLGFHAAWRPDTHGRAVTSEGGTQLLMEVYPQNVRNWIAQRGGLTPRLMILSGRELFAMYRPCQGTDVARRPADGRRAAQPVTTGSIQARDSRRTPSAQIAPASAIKTIAP